MTSDKEEMKELYQNICDQVSYLKELIRQNLVHGSVREDYLWQRAKGEVFGHIEMSLNNNHEYVGKHSLTLEECLQQMSVMNDPLRQHKLFNSVAEEATNIFDY